MRSCLYLSLALGSLACGCGAGPNEDGSEAAPVEAASFGPEDQQAIRQVMTAQEEAWDRGDIPGFMKGYSDSVCFISRNGRTCGTVAVTANYQKNYPDKAAMGHLTFGDLEIMGAGPEHAWCTGNWELIRAQDTIGGGFSLLWQRTDRGWLILRDHTY